MFKLFKAKYVNNYVDGYVAYRRIRFGSTYPNLSKDEENEMKKLFPKIQKINKLGNIEHPNIYYKALYLSKILDDTK